jgi:hypothetical protein
MPKRHFRKPAWIVSLILLTLFGALFVYASIATKPARLPAPLDRGRFMSDQESDLRATFHDPESVRFRNDVVRIVGNNAFVCGEINYRNSTNGYVGFRHFAFGPGIPKFDNESAPDRSADLWREHCGSAH